MSFPRPTLSELVDRSMTALDAAMEGTSSRLRRSTTRVLATTHAGGLHGLYGYLSWIAKQTLPDQADEAGLARWGTLLNVPQRPAIAARISVSITGISGAVVEADTLLQRVDGVLYRVEETVTLASATDTLTLQCGYAGDIGNCDNGLSLQFLSPIAGIGTPVTVIATLTAGLDAEGLEGWRTRLLKVLARPRSSGRQDDYVRWLLDISGITRAWCLPTHAGPGTVGITFMRDAEDGVPSAEQLEDVRTYLQERMPVGVADLIVFAPTLQPVDCRILLSPSSTLVRTAVVAALERVFHYEAAPGGRIYISHLREAISMAAGEMDHRLLAPSDDVVATTGVLPVLGAVTWE